MKRFIDRKHTINIALIIVAVIGIALGGFIASTGNNMTKVKPANIESSSGGAGSGRYAAFGADFYTYIYGAVEKASTSTSNTAYGVQTVNENLQDIADAQCKLIKTVGKAVMMFGFFTVALFLCIGCTAVKINPCYVYDESKDRKYQKYIQKHSETENVIADEPSEETLTD